jgi:hypothetical protein
MDRRSTSARDAAPAAGATSDVMRCVASASTGARSGSEPAGSGSPWWSSAVSASCCARRGGRDDGAGASLSMHASAYPLTSISIVKIGVQV